MPVLADTSNRLRTVRFGVFEVDFQLRELRKRGLRIRVQEKPFRVLELLLERPGEIVPRAELRDRLWPDTFVGFERSLNTAVNSLRCALGDCAANPRFIETRARQGYRFIFPLEYTKPPAQEPARGVEAIAVLPFQNSIGDPETEYLSDGITEGVINNLSRLHNVKVMARSTVFHFKGRTDDPRRAGRELDADAVLVGEVASSGDSLRISLELVHVKTGWRLWGEQYIRKLSELFAVEEQIAREISERLKLQLTSQEDRLLARHPTSNMSAYQDYLKGRYYWNRMTEDSVKKAVSCFEHAIEKDPSFALAYAGLADAYSLFAFFDMVSPQAALPRARGAALKALQIDEGLAEAHISLAGIIKASNWDWHGSEREYRRALELNPNSAEAHRHYACLLAAMGKTHEALRENHLALELDPLSLAISMEKAWLLYMAREHARAVQQLLETLDLEPAFAPAHYVLALAYEQMGNFEVAAAAFGKIQAFVGNNSTALAGLGHVFAMAGHKTKAFGTLKVLEELARQRYVAPYSFALLFAGLGKLDQAFEWLEKSLECHDAWLVWLDRDPRLDNLRLDPRYAAFRLRLGHPTKTDAADEIGRRG